MSAIALVSQCSIVSFNRFSFHVSALQTALEDGQKLVDAPVALPRVARVVLSKLLPHMLRGLGVMLVRNGAGADALRHVSRAVREEKGQVGSTWEVMAFAYYDADRLQSSEKVG